jgi:uncharacterized protein YhbP (UPF0306 family)
MVSFQHNDHSSRELWQCIRRIVKSAHLCALSTVSPSGTPHVNTLFFCFNVNFDLFFISDTNARHSRFLSKAPRAAIAIYDSHLQWGGSLRGLQLFGHCRLASDLEARQASTLYGTRFPAYLTYIASLDAKTKAESPHKFYKFHPTSVKVFDENTFGEEVFLSAKIRRS